MKPFYRTLLSFVIATLLMSGWGGMVYAQIDLKQKKNQSQPRKADENKDNADQPGEVQDRLEDDEADREEEVDGYARMDLIPMPEKEEFQPGKVRVKVNPDYRGQCTPQNIAIPGVQAKVGPLGVTRIHRAFPQAQRPSEQTDKYGRKYVDLTLVYEIEFDPNFPVEEAVKLLKEDPSLLYVEPAWIMREFYTPDDPKYGNAYHLALIKAAEAWDISKGDSAVVIGIVDTGHSLTHPDLVNKTAFNLNDPIDGVDNDGDGYVDNYHGWDFAGGGYSGPDNDPTYVGPDHGVLVAGAAAADTDNNWGVASVGFNCSILPIKVTRDNSSGVIYGYSGLIYAADHGAQIINCSWGSGAASQFGEDAVNYAVINKGCLVICAAGNTPGFFNVYPAAYDNSFSVGGSDQNDNAWYDTPTFGTSWNYAIDIVAPAKSIRTTSRHNLTWGGATGTSLAAPIVAGAAGIVKSHFPNLTMDQVGQQLRVTSDDIYTLNPGQTDLLGRGRLNLYAALTETPPAIRLEELSFTDDNNNIPEGFDTVAVTGQFFNWLDATGNLNVQIVAMDTALIEVIDGNQNLGVINTLSSKNNSQPFRVRVKKPMANRTEAWVKLIYTDPTQNYHDFEYATILLEPTTFNIDTNKVSITISDDGNFGFTSGYPTPNELGIRYDGSVNLLNSSGGLLIGTGPNQLSDCVLGPFYNPDTDFIGIDRTYPDASGNLATLVVKNHYDDSRNLQNALGVEVTQRIFADTRMEYDDFLIFEYLLENNSGNDYASVRAGFFADWNLTHSDHVPDLNMIYTWDPDSSHYPYMGLVALDITNTNVSTYDKNLFTMNAQNKWDALDNAQSPKSQSGAEILTFAASGNFSLLSGEETTVAFALVGGEDLNELKKNAKNAWQKYHCDLYSRTPTPLDLGMDLGLCPGVSAEISADTGYQSYRWSHGPTTPTINVNQAGTYMLEVVNEYFCSTTDEVVVSEFIAPEVDLGISVGFCTGTSVELDAGLGLTAYRWSTGDSSETVTVTTPGVYSVEVEDANGCTATDQVTVALFPNITPNLENEYFACSGNSVTLDPGLGYINAYWSNGANTREITVNYPGTYSVNLVDDNGCTYTDQTVVTLVEVPVPQLGPNQAACDGAVITLDAGAGYHSYAWSNGASSASIDVTTTGRYQLEVSSPEGCTASAEVDVTIFPVPVVELGDSLVLCQSGELDAGVSGAAYLWSNGETTRTIWVEESGTYEVQVYTLEGCQAMDVIEVVVEKLSAGFEME